MKAVLNKSPSMLLIFGCWIFLACHHVTVSLLLMKGPLRKLHRFAVDSQRGGRWSLSSSPPSAIRFMSKGTDLEVEDSSSASVGNVAIIGGGLAGLSTTYHLLQKSPDLNITIFDKTKPGTGGASAVAGGLLHPLSPRGKLVHRGLEGLFSTNSLIDAALCHEEDAVLRNEIWRIAVTENQVSTLKKTASEFPEFTQWFTREDLLESGDDFLAVEKQPEIQGALRLHSGCRVLHVPTYLIGLWKACQSLGSGKKQWIIDESLVGVEDVQICAQRLSDYDAVVLAAGAGLFQNSKMICDVDEKLVQIVRGQSVELKFTDDSSISKNLQPMLCGKYVSPLPDDRRLLVGATHEFKEEALSPDEVENEMKERTMSFASEVWLSGTVDTITTGFRVQSARGNLGRLPIVGSISSTLHSNAWIFTGLSSRGLLYHGLFGDLLSDMIMGQGNIEDEYPVINWWKE